MKEILEKLQELVGQCEARLKRFDQQDAELRGRRATLDEQKRRQGITEKVQADERKKLDEMKSIAKTIGEAEEIKRQASIDRDNLNTQKEHFEIEKKGFRKDVMLEKHEIRRGWKELEKEKKRYKKDVLKAIAREEKNGDN